MIKLVSNGDWLSASALLPVLFDVALKSALVLLLALVVAGCLRKRSAAARHLVWFLAVVSLLFLPVLSLTLPAWHVLPHYFNTLPNPPANETQDAARKSDALILSPPPAQDSEARIPFQRPPAEDLERIPASQIGTAPSPVQFQPQPRLAEPTPAASAPSVPARSAFSKHWVWMIWLLGAAIALLPVGIGMFSLWRLSRSSRQETEPSWLDLLQSLKATLRVRRPVKLLKSNQRRMPMTWGVLRTKLLLPKESNQWSEVRRRVVLLHELAHVKRWDYHTNLFTQIVRAVYWFNPLVWFAARRMVAERERACDDIVLRHGAKPADYAEQILEIASGLRLEGFSAFGGIPMARPSKLEGRLRAILDSTRNRAAMTRMMVIGVTAVIASIVIPVAMLRAAPDEQSQTPAKTDAVKATTNSPAVVATNTQPKVRIEPADVTNANPQPVTIELHPWNTAPTETPSTIVLPKNAIIGRVIDVETGQPIPEFAVTPGSGLAPDMLLWRPEETVKGTNGAFSVAKTEPERLDYFKIEVPGYMQEMVSERTLLTNNTVKLHRGEFITGRVLDAEGHPVAGAQVALSLVNTIVRLSGTNFGPSPWEQSKWQRSPITTTDSRGEFWLPAGPGRLGLIAVGKDGFAFVKLDHFESSKEIQLEPWVKITGTLSSAGQSLKGKSVQINASGAFAGLWMSFYTNLVTDSGGHFSYDQVPPGAAQLSFARPGLDFSRRLSNAPGSTVNLQLSLPPEPWTNRRPGIDDQIVWGPETNGLQSGISLAERPQPRKAGEIITVDLWLRNRSSETIYGTNYYWSDLELQGGKETHVPATGPWPYLVDEQNSDRSRVKVEPGAELRLKTTTVQIPNLSPGTYKLSNLSTHHRGLESPTVTVNGGELLIEIASNSPAEQRSTETARSHPSQSISDIKSSEQTNALPQADSITGHVVDAETGLAIPDFRITPGSGWAAPDILPWRTEETARGTNGIFRVPMPQPDRLDYYKIEMPGYMPEMVSERALLTNNIVKLHRGEFITGRVLDVNGRPVTGVQVALHLIRTEIRLMGTNLYSYTSMLSNFQSSPITTTDTRGEFKLRAGPGRNGLIAASAEGFAFVKLDRDEILKEIRLEPWVKVAGTLVSGGKPLKGKTVRVMAGDYAIGRLGLWYFDTNLVTDVAGRFSYDRVPTGDTEIAFEKPGVYVSHRVSGTAGAAFNVEMSVPTEPWTNRSPAIADQIVWGPETNGVQSGISLAERLQPRKAGEIIIANLWLRNKSAETIYRTNYDASVPDIFAGDEALVPWKVPWPRLVDEQYPDLSRVKVEPGAELRMKTVTLQIPNLAPGTYKLQNLSYYRYGTPNGIQVISGDIPLQIAIGSATNQPASSRDP